MKWGKFDKCLNRRKEIGVSKEQMRPRDATEVEKEEEGKTRLSSQKAEASRRGSILYVENHDKHPLLREILKNEVFKQINNCRKNKPQMRSLSSNE